MNFHLSPAEARVLGCLIEKEVTTPDYYPLSLNALQNAANQKSNRDPVMELDEEAIRRALHSLSEQGLARQLNQDSVVARGGRCFRDEKRQEPSLRLESRTIEADSELAEDAGVDRAFISSIERSKRNPSFRTVASIGQALRMRFARLVDNCERCTEDKRDKTA